MLGPLNELDVALEDPDGLVRLISDLHPRARRPALKQVQLARPDLCVAVFPQGGGIIQKMG